MILTSQQIERFRMEMDEVIEEMHVWVDYTRVRCRICSAIIEYNENGELPELKHAGFCAVGKVQKTVKEWGKFCDI